MTPENPACPTPTPHWLRRGWKRTVSVTLGLHQNRASLHASAMAFSLFLGMVPLAAILGWALARFSGAQFRQSVVASLIAVTPQPAVNLVDEQLRRLVDANATVAPFGMAGFLWLAAGSAHTAMGAVQTSQTGQERPWWVNRVLSLLFVLAFLLVVTGSTALLILSTPTLQHALHTGRIEQAWPTAVRVGALPMSFVVATVGSAAFFRVAGHREAQTERRAVWPGSFATAALWVLVSWAFGHYVERIGRFPLFYGSLAAVALLLIWLWICSFVLLVGAEVNAQLQGSRKTLLPPSIGWIRHRVRHPLRRRR